MIEKILQIFVAIFVVLLLHELGHGPERIKFRFGLPVAAMKSKRRYGGLVVNVIIFLTIFFTRPENPLLQYAGLFAWIHFIIYSVLGSVLPEKAPRRSQISRHIYDDIPNSLAQFFIVLAAIVFFLFREYYIMILRGLFQW